MSPPTLVSRSVIVKATSSAPRHPHPHRNSIGVGAGPSSPCFVSGTPSMASAPGGGYRGNFREDNPPVFQGPAGSGRKQMRRKMRGRRVTVVSVEG